MPRPSKAEIGKYAALSEAQAAHEAAGGLSRNGPLFRAAALEALDQLQRRFAGGDAWALITAMNSCAVHDLVMPDWLAREWLRRSRAAMFYAVASWDEVLPPIKPKGRKLSALRMAREWSLGVVQAVHGATAAGRAIDEQLFDELAERNRWPFSGAKAKKLYYAAKKKPDAATSLYFAQRADPSRRKRSPATSTIRRKT